MAYIHGAMFKRLFKPPKNYSYFIFGARGTGKTTFIKNYYQTNSSEVIYIDLLDLDEEENFQRQPFRLKELIKAKEKSLKIIIIDEIQKVPALLDVVHQSIEAYKHIQFILLGSSARKLRHGAANLLAGRAFSYNFYTLSFLELPDTCKISELLAFGTLPKIFDFDDDNLKFQFLKTYSQTYLKQEIQIEQLVKDIVSFREFLDLAAQTSGEIVNFKNIENKSRVSEKTIARYFEILEDTLIGFYLEPFDESVRVRQSRKPKFYLFDTGITRYLNQRAKTKLIEGSSEFGNLFEQFIISECKKLNDYYEKDYKFYYLRTKDGAEIDLIVKKPGNIKILIEIKSGKSIESNKLKNLKNLSLDIEHKDKWVICQEKVERVTEAGIRILPWKIAFKELFELN